MHEESKIISSFLSVRIIILIIFILQIIINFNDYENSNEQIDNNSIILDESNSTVNLENHKKIKIGICINNLRNGGIERLTSLLLDNFAQINIFDIYLLTNSIKQKDEYKINDKVKRIYLKKDNLIQIIKKKKIDIIIYHPYNEMQIKSLNQLKTTKTIVYDNSCILFWLYADSTIFFKTIYKQYQSSKYVISLISFENDYLFKKWGINSILMNNFISYNYDDVIPSDLSSDTILMIGRAESKFKRFELGIVSMKFITEQIPNCEMKIVSEIQKGSYLQNKINSLNLQNNIHFMGYTSTPEIYFKNASLHLFPSISEAFPMVLSETKIYGIPTLLIGLDYITLAKEGTVIIYDDNPKIIAEEAIKILKDKNYKKKLGRESRRSMKKFNNKRLLKKWIKLLLSISKGYEYYQELRKNSTRLTESEAINIIHNQLKLLKKRKPKYANMTINDLENFSYIQSLT